MGINILGIGSFVPPLTVDNNMMSTVVDTNDEWIRTRTGISTRHMTNGEPAWHMGLKAAEKAVAESGIDPKDIGLIIDSTITHDFHTPAAACFIQRELGAENAACYDIAAACTGFVYAVDNAMRYLMTDDTIKYALVAANESLSRITNFEDRSSCVLFGDGAAAVVLEKSDKLFSSWLGTDGNGIKYLYCKSAFPDHPFMTDDRTVISDGTDGNTDHSFIAQDGKEVYKFATKALPNAALRAAEKAGLSAEDIDWFVPHQANIRIIETAAKNLGVSMDKFILTIDRFGNTSSASIPLAFDDAVHSGKIKRGDKVCFIGFGAGLTQGAVLFEY